MYKYLLQEDKNLPKKFQYVNTKIFSRFFGRFYICCLAFVGLHNSQLTMESHIIEVTKKDILLSLTAFQNQATLDEKV